MLASNFNVRLSIILLKLSLSLIYAYVLSFDYCLTRFKSVCSCATSCLSREISWFLLVNLSSYWVTILYFSLSRFLWCSCSASILKNRGLLGSYGFSYCFKILCIRLLWAKWSCSRRSPMVYYLLATSSSVQLSFWRSYLVTSFSSLRLFFSRCIVLSSF